MRIILLLIATICLSACSVAPSSSPGTTSPGASLIVSESPEAEQIPTTADNFTAKLNDKNEAAIEIVTYDNANNPHLRYMHNGETRTQPITDIPWLHYASGQAADLDGDGCDELIFLLWTGGSGGMGSNALCVFRWDGEGFVPHVPTPKNPENLESDRLGFGFDAEITLMDAYQARLYCPDTDLTHDFAVNQVYSNPNIYDTDGKLNGDATVIDTGIDAIACLQVRSLKKDQSITIAQMLWASTHAAIAVLVTEFTYQNGTLVLINQFVDSNIEAYN